MYTYFKLRLIFLVQEWEIMPDLFFHREVASKLVEGDSSEESGEESEGEKENMLDREDGEGEQKVEGDGNDEDWEGSDDEEAKPA